MATQRRNFAVKRSAAVDLGCSCRRRSPRPPSFFSPVPKAKLQNTRSLVLSPSSTTTIWETSRTSVSSTAAAAPAPTGPSSSSSPSCFADYSSPSLSPDQLPSPTESPETTAAVEKNTDRETKGGVAVVVESSDPYADFRGSMLEMVLESEICAWEELCDLLHCFLALNAPRHHHVIIHAFAEVYRVIFSSEAEPAAASTSDSATPHRRR